MKEFFLFGYFSLFVGFVLALYYWEQRQRKRRLPFPDDLRLLRGPGETQFALVREQEVMEIVWLILAGCAPVAVLAVLLWIVLKLPEPVRMGGAVVALLASAVVFWASARWFTGRMRECLNRYLGYFGERVVAEYLEPLRAQGWRVFHDVPATAGGKSFNLDHVVVGPKGVAVIETKTRRKSTNARPGFEGHKVFFNGHELVWPWGEDSHGLAQAESNATWLADTILAETGERVAVAPLLALPGWWVEMKPASNPRACRVTNPKNIPLIIGSQVDSLTPGQIGAIAAKLEARCRTVEY